MDIAQADKGPDPQGMPVEGTDNEPDMSEPDVEGIQDDEYFAEVNDDTGFQDLGVDGGDDEDDEDNFHYIPKNGDESPTVFRPKDYWKFTDSCLNAVWRHAHKKLSNRDEYQTVYAR